MGAPVGRWILGTAAVIALSTTVACGGDGSGAGADEVIDHYAAGVHASYAASLESARALDATIDAFVAAPSDQGLSDARQAWLTARDDYGLTEAFRFYGGPIDDEETGVEGQINAWPLDEAYIDYVEGDADAGIVNGVGEIATITPEAIAEVNEVGGETNVSTGWHAIEFLLWGQDLSEEGPGARPVTDYTTADNADRRAAYLSAASDLLVSDLEELIAAWEPDADNYAAEFTALPEDEALSRMFVGIGELSRGELAGERMNVAYSERSQEDEHSCFSDNTVADFVANAAGIEMVVTGGYPGIDGPGLAALVEGEDPELADRLRTDVVAGTAAAGAIPAPFDQHVRPGVPDSDPGRVAVLEAIETLEDGSDTIVAAADSLGVTVNLS